MLPKVVIVGRPNVGKSSLLNMLAGRRVSIVDATAGVTRDRISATVELTPPSNFDDDATHAIELIDTGGYGIEDVQDLTTDVEQQIAFGVAEADLILFVVDAQTGIVPLDEQVARLLRTGGTTAPILLIANKVDSANWEAGAMDAASLGFGMPLSVSATSKRNADQLNDAIRQRINFTKFEELDGEDAVDPGMLLAIVGKRNAGKSTFVNALAQEERVIVSDVEGTTRDSVDVRFQIDDKVFTAIDTAGVRKRKSLKGDIEFYSNHRAMRSIRRADVCMFLIDSSLPVSMVDKQLAAEIVKHHKPTVVVINKWDLAEEEYTQEEYVEYLDNLLRGLSFAPIIFLSAKKNEGVRDAIAMGMNLYQQAGHRVGTGELNRVVTKIVAERMPVSKLGKRPKLYYVTQLDVFPPTLGFFVNNPDLFENNYQRFLLNRLREELPYSEVPIRLTFRTRKRIPIEERLASREGTLPDRPDFSGEPGELDGPDAFENAAPTDD